jgi:sugar fermentation stimulation protein A
LIDCYLEVKSVTLLDAHLFRYEHIGGMGCFPDAVSARGQKHLKELMVVKQQGERAVVLFCVMHTGINAVTAAQHIDAIYSKLLEQAQIEGVEVLAYACDITPDCINLARAVPVL